jgi:hypothetical protein
VGGNITLFLEPHTFLPFPCCIWRTLPNTLPSSAVVAFRFVSLFVRQSPISLRRSSSWRASSSRSRSPVSHSASTAPPPSASFGAVPIHRYKSKRWIPFSPSGIAQMMSVPRLVRAIGLSPIGRAFMSTSGSVWRLTSQRGRMRRAR